MTTTHNYNTRVPTLLLLIILNLVYPVAAFQVSPSYATVPAPRRGDKVQTCTYLRNKKITSLQNSKCEYGDADEICNNLKPSPHIVPTHNDKELDQLLTRRNVLQSSLVLPISITATLSAITSRSTIPDANAAPPIAIIAEELGYFPITKDDVTMYVPARVKRDSTDQSILLANHLKEIGATMYGAYWCPHCQHQKEIFGKQAWNSIPYVECSIKGYGYDAKLLPPSVQKDIEGFPTWRIPRKTVKKKGFGRGGDDVQFVSGEMPLERLAKLSGYEGEFDLKLEGTTPVNPGAC